MKIILLAIMLFLSVSGQQTYYGNNPRGCCGENNGVLNPEVDWETNYICNGDFEKPALPSDKAVVQIDRV